VNWLTFNIESKGCQDLYSAFGFGIYPHLVFTCFLESMNGIIISKSLIGSPTFCSVTIKLKLVGLPACGVAGSN
jgi:hypothetical protein